MVNKENYYREYKGHTKWLCLISSHFAKKIWDLRYDNSENQRRPIAAIFVNGPEPFSGVLN